MQVKPHLVFRKRLLTSVFIEKTVCTVCNLFSDVMKSSKHDKNWLTRNCLPQIIGLSNKIFIGAVQLFA